MGRATALFVLSVASVVGALIGCGRENATNPPDGGLPAEVTLDAEYLGPGLFIGPLEGLTLGWHVAPEEIPIPVGTQVVLLAIAPDAARFTWVGAEEIETTSRSSKAVCRIDELGLYAASVDITLKPDGKEDVEIGRRRVRSHACFLTAVDIHPDEIKIHGIEVEDDPLGLTEASSNEETYRVFQRKSVAKLRNVGESHYQTSVDRPTPVRVRVEPELFSAFIEWRDNGIPIHLGSEAVLEFSDPGAHRVEIGPIGSGADLVFDTYEVTMQMPPRVPNGRPVYLTAVTDPPGLEHLITWVSSTSYGTAKPVLGSGPNFTVQFDNTFHDFQWLGVRADNAILNQDEKTCPPNTLPDLVSSASGGDYEYETRSKATQDPKNGRLWTIEQSIKNDLPVRNIRFNWAAGIAGGLFNGQAIDERENCPTLKFSWLAPDCDTKPSQFAAQLQMKKIFVDSLTTNAPVYGCPAPVLSLPFDVPSLRTIWDNLVKTATPSLIQLLVRVGSKAFLASSAADGRSGPATWTYEYTIVNESAITLPIYIEGITTSGTVILAPNDSTVVSVNSTQEPIHGLRQAQLPSIVMEEVASDVFVDTTIGVSAGHFPPAPSNTTLAWPTIVYVPM